MNLKKLFSAILIASAPALLINSAYAEPKKSDNVVRTKSYKYASKASLQASVSKQVAQDKLRITVTTELSEDDQQVVAAKLTDSLNKAMKLAKENSNENIKVTSGSYHVWPMNNKDGLITNWRGRAQIYIESEDFVGASKLAQSLEQYMTISSFNFFVSSKTRSKVEQELLNDVADAFNTRASDLTKALGFNNYRIDKVDLGGRGAVYHDSVPRMAVMAAPASMSEPINMEAGTENISLDMSGTIYLLND